VGFFRALEAARSLFACWLINHVVNNERMNADALSCVFSALADPTRRAILARLSAGEAPVKALAAPFDLSAPAISKHLKVLENAGLISRGRERQQRPCKLEAKGLAMAADWIEQYRAFWEESFDRLDAYLKTVTGPAEAASATPANKKKRRASRAAKTTRAKGAQHGRR
jgi:DNA-binding transcriptional ArsR family regulator